MKRIVIMVALAVLLFSAAVQAQAPAPKPGPEQKKLHVWNGDWTYEGEAMASPLGPAEKFTGKATVKMILGGFCQEWRFEEKHPGNLLHGVQITAHDPVNKNYISNIFVSDGSIELGTMTVNGNVWESSFTLILGAKQYKLKGKDVLSEDMMSDTFKSEISADGKTWKPFWEVHFTKIVASPKK
jgi:hypothetical protein